MFTQRGLSTLKNTFLRTVGSDIVIFITIDVKIVEKLIVNACDLVVTTVEKKNPMTM